MKLPKILVDFVLGSDNAKKTIAEIVGKTTENLAKEAAQIIKEKTTPRKYVTTSTRSGIMAKEQSTKKDMSLLWEVYSDAPGSVQSANRITESVIGGGYVIEKEVGPGARKATQKDLRRLIDFFDRPNPDDTIETLMSSGLENFLAYGDWYMEKVPTKRTRTGRKFTIAELYGMNTADMTILVDPDIRKRGILKKVGYKRKTEEEKDIIYDLNEICQVRRPSSTAGVYGRAVLETNGLVLQLLLRALVYNTSVLRNGGRPPIQIVLPEDTNEADADAVNVFYEANQMGPQNAGKPLVLFKGAKAEAIGITPQDMAYLELIMTGIKLVAGQYGVPLFLIGFPEGSNRASSSEERRAFYYTNIYPLRKYVSHKFTNEIIKEGMGIEGWKLNFRGQGLEESEATRRDLMTAWGKGLANWNDVRIKMGWLPADEKWASEYYLLGSKNDSLMPIEDAIGKEPSQSAPEVPQIKPSIGQGEGADMQPTGEGRGKETKNLIKKIETLVEVLNKQKK